MQWTNIIYVYCSKSEIIIVYAQFEFKFSQLTVRQSQCNINFCNNNNSVFVNRDSHSFSFRSNIMNQKLAWRHSIYRHMQGSTIIIYFVYNTTVGLKVPKLSMATCTSRIYYISKEQYLYSEESIEKQNNVCFHINCVIIYYCINCSIILVLVSLVCTL